MLYLCMYVCMYVCCMYVCMYFSRQPCVHLFRPVLVSIPIIALAALFERYFPCIISIYFYFIIAVVAGTPISNSGSTPAAKPTSKAASSTGNDQSQNTNLNLAPSQNANLNLAPSQNANPCPPSQNAPCPKSSLGSNLKRARVCMHTHRCDSHVCNIAKGAD